MSSMEPNLCQKVHPFEKKKSFLIEKLKRLTVFLTFQFELVAPKTMNEKHNDRKELHTSGSTVALTTSSKRRTKIVQEGVS